MTKEFFKNCLRCGGQNLDFCKVNTALKLAYPEVEHSFGPITQRIIMPTDGVVCKDCGHIELVFDWEENHT